jgi:signal transduction histidine kinase
VKGTFGLRAALIVLVLIAIAPVFAIVVQASMSEREARLERAADRLESMVSLGAAAYRGVHELAVELPEDFGLLLVDASGIVLESSGAGRVAAGQPLPERFLLAALGRSVEAGRAFGSDGNEWLYRVQRVEGAPRGPLYVAGIASVHEVIEPASRGLRVELFALSLVALLGAALAWAFGDRVFARPMQRLLDRVDALSREDVDLRKAARPSALRELRELEKRFHAMARTLLERSVQRDGALAEIGGQDRLLESVFESMAEGVLVLDAKGRFLHINAAALKIMPGLAELQREMGPEKAVPGELGLFDLNRRPLEPHERPVVRVLRGEKVDHFRILLHGRLSHGEERIIQGRARELVFGEGRRYGAVVVFSDITAEYRAEQELRRMNETLERRVAERTRELAIANSELESFSYSVSHDLRAPLQVIDGFGRALLARHTGQLDERGRHYLQRIGDNTVQMGNLIDDLLSLSRVTRTPLRREMLDLAPRARRIVEQLHQRDPDRHVAVEIDDTIPCVGDPGLLTVLLDNLIANAWKFTAHCADASIRVGSSEVRPGERIYHVVDNGAGFDMAYAGKLFGAFQRLHTAAEFPGSGIGLATVNRVVLRHGGRVWAEAEPGRGATFRFTLQGEENEKQHHPPGRGQPGSPGTDAHDAGREQCSQ